MKKVEIFLLCLLLSFGAYASKFTITNSGNTFTPDNISIVFGDTVIFSISSSHNVIEVSKATWDANGNTPLPGGFSLPFGGGSLYNITYGLHYYVCSVHASMGMKGIINVSNSSINEIKSGKQINLKVYPDPVNNIMNIEFTLKDDSPGIVQLVDLVGKTVYSENITSSIGKNVISIDLSALKPGFYYMVFKQDKDSYAEKILKM